MSSAETSYDFVIVGGGAAGCLLASRLAKALTQCSILLIDAGASNADVNHQSFGERLWTFVLAPGYNWGYKTVPQEYLQGREVDYSRGKGLGGSTAINFCVYTRGCKADYDRWAQLVGDDAWRWENSLGRFKTFENFSPPLEQYKPFLEVSPAAHGFDGPLDIGVPHIWDPEFAEYFEKVTLQYPKNLDHNSGDPTGLSICQTSAVKGRRTAAHDAFLSDAPSNLTILTNAPVTKVLFEGEKAVGVEVSGKKKVRARKEVILSAGAVDSPKLLLLSGIGPKEEIAKLNIPVVHDLPGIGKNLRDHLWLELVVTQKPGSHHRTSYINSPQALEEARLQYVKDQTGQMLGSYQPQVLGFLKSEEVFGSPEFKELDSATQKSIRAETKPDYEIISHIPTFSVQAPDIYLGYLIAFMGVLSTGEVTLRSADAADPPLIDPKFLSHPYDRRVAIESIRGALKLMNLPALAGDQASLASGPASQSDEDILKYVESHAISMWHACGTVKMGKPAAPDTCVDTEFRVTGVQGLRVVDMSVAPLMPAAHTQAVAYVIAETAAEKIISEYS